MNCVAAVTAGYGSFFRLKLASSYTSDTKYYMTCAIHKSYVQWMDNLVLFQITVIMNMSAVEECEGECWAGWDTWDYWSSVWIEGVILPAIAALGIAGCRCKTLRPICSTGRPFSINVHTLFGVVSKQQPQEEN